MKDFCFFRIVNTLVRKVSAYASAMSSSTLSRCAKGLGFLLWYGLPARRNYATDCIAERLQLPAEKAKEIARKSFDSNALSFCEIVHAPQFSFATHSDHIIIAQPELYARMLTSQRPIVAATAHIGSWELLAGLLGDFVLKKTRMIVVRRNPNPTLNQLMTDFRGGRGAEIIDHRHAAFKVLKGLKHNGLVAFLVDHNASRSESIFLPFLGKTAAVNMGPAILGLRANALIWPFFLLRKDNSFIIETAEPLDPALLLGSRAEKIEAICAFYTEAVERMVRKYPEQWFWMHKRWKTRPEDEG